MSIQSTINQALSVGGLLTTQTPWYQGKVQQKKNALAAKGYERSASEKQNARVSASTAVPETVNPFGYTAETSQQILEDLQNAYNLEPTAERAATIERVRGVRDFFSSMERKSLETQEAENIRAAVADQRRMDAEVQARSQLQQRANEVRETRDLSTNIAKARVGETLQDVPVTITSKEDTPVRESSEKVTERKENSTEIKPESKAEDTEAKINKLIKQSGMNPSAFTPETKAKMLAEYEKGGKA